MLSLYPSLGLTSATTFVYGAAAAGLQANPSGIEAVNDTLQDSLRVSVNRSTPGQVTLSVSGVARHFNPSAAPGAAGAVLSRLRLTVYPDTTSAKNETGAVATGEMVFTGSTTVQSNGLFGPADFTNPTVIGDGNDYEVATVGGLTKVVTVPNPARRPWRWRWTR